MRLTIIADDSSVSIDGESFSGLSPFELDASIHAVQWYDSWGEVEFKTIKSNGVLVKPENEIIDSILNYQWALDVWNEAKAAFEEELASLSAPASELPVSTPSEPT